MRYFLCVLLLVVPFVVLAQSTSSNFRLNQIEIGPGEFDASSGSYRLKSSVGGNAVGTARSAGFVLDQGRTWYVTPPPTTTIGGGAEPEDVETGVRLSGRAYPLTQVEVLKDGQRIAVTIAGPDAKFLVEVTNMSSGSHMFSVIGVDPGGERSIPLSVPVTLTKGVMTTISGLYIAPSIGVDKRAVKHGDNLAIFGHTTPSSDVVISVHSPVELFFASDSDKDGVFLYNLDTVVLNRGTHETKAKAKTQGEASNFGRSVSFLVGDQNIPFGDTKCAERGDLNGDCRVNLIDFSIGSFWYQKTITLQFQALETSQLNGDGVVDLRDFSVMAFYWTG